MNAALTSFYARAAFIKRTRTLMPYVALKKVARLLQTTDPLMKALGLVWAITHINSIWRLNSAI